MSRSRPAPLLCLLGLAGCDPGDSAAAHAGAAPSTLAPTCEVVETALELPEEVRETSGLARGRRNPSLLWTHNDRGNDPDLLALDERGRLSGRVRVSGVEPGDWEDLEMGPCGAGDCLFVADIGDNDGDRPSVSVHLVPEPSPGDAEARPAGTLGLRFPDGPRDAEALFVLPGGELYLVTKGRHGPIALYRYPGPARPGGTATLERVRELFPEPTDADDRVTAAAATPDGRWVGIRTYRTLYLYPAAELVAGDGSPTLVFDLAPLGEPQGESLVLADDGAVWLTSEAENRREPARMSHLRCTLQPGTG